MNATFEDLSALAESQYGEAFVAGGGDFSLAVDIGTVEFVHAAGDAALLQRLEEAWNAMRALTADATLDAKVDAVHKLVVAMVLAYRN